MSLPRVTENCDKALLRSSAEDPEFISKSLTHLDEVNPVISNMLRGICEEFNVGENPTIPLNKAIGMAVLVYRQLESQVEADEMQKQILG